MNADGRFSESERLFLTAMSNRPGSAYERGALDALRLKVRDPDDVRLVEMAVENQGGLR
jgi:hypothetical protein